MENEAKYSTLARLTYAVSVMRHMVQVSFF